LFGKHMEAPYCTFLILFTWILSNIHSKHCNIRGVVYMGIVKHSF